MLRLFKWEDYHDGYMITFHPQTTFERFDDLVSRVKKTWSVFQHRPYSLCFFPARRDDFEIDVPPGERLELLQPEDVPLWRGHTPELIKVEVSDGVGHQYSDATVCFKFGLKMRLFPLDIPARSPWRLLVHVCPVWTRNIWSAVRSCKPI